VADLNEQMNVAGAGINTARRVMDCGDAGHILLSKHVAEDLEEYEEWRPRLHDLGTCEMKHGVRIGITNVYDSEVGNPQLPKKLQALKRHRTRLRWAEVTIALLVLAAIATAFVFLLRKPKRSALEIVEKSIAVLPFENLSRDPDNAYFAEGIQNEILTRLATVRDLKVISRTSTAKYQSKPGNLKTVAQELGVSTILEGAVQKAGDKVRVNVQLIDARADTHLWGKSYDRDFKDVLGVESEVSQQIADALQAKLSPSESNALAAVGTHDAEAYDLFLRGEYEFHQAQTSLAPDAYDRADAFYRQALARDPNFAQAAAELARSRLTRHWFISPLAPAELEEVKSIIDRALALAPNSPETHFALGLFFYYGHRRYENALAEFDRTLELQPSNALARQYSAYVFRRRGEWERSLADLQRAQELDPRDVQIPANIGGTYSALRLWKQAERAELRALAIDPHSAFAAALLAANRLNATGDVDAAKRVLDGFPESIRIRAGGSGVDTGGDVTEIIDIRPYLDVIRRRFADAFQALDKELVNDDRGRLQQLAGHVILRVLAGDPEAAKSQAEQALPLLEARFRDRPDDNVAMTWLSWVYLALGRNADALRLSRQAADSLPIEKDARAGPSFQIGLAQIEGRAGAPEQAIKRLRHLLSIPAGLVASIARLKIDPVWDPIRNRPDFQQLLSGPEQIGPNNKPTTSTQTLAEKPTFASDIRPILESRCQPCHFQGGKMYEQLPFDKPETITKLGTKLFTRIKNEDQQRLIRAFLSEQSASADR
jgi:TolB-like protein/Tfp pilus assembly protein PilF